MWILLTRKLPTRPSPPMLSIFWCIPDKNHKKQNLVPVSIIYKGESITVFNFEYSVLSEEKMNTIINDNSEPYSLVVGAVRQNEGIESLNEKERILYEQAILDGAYTENAILLAKGFNIEGGVIPIIGWFRPKKSLIKIFSNNGVDYCEN